MRLSPRVTDIPASLNLALHVRAQKIDAEHGDVVNMSVGEPDFDAPTVVQDAAREFIGSGRVRYTAAAGTTSLRGAIARHLQATRGLSYEASEITVCHSAKHAIAGAVLALCTDGDEVLLPAPAWLSYEEQIKFTGARAVWVAGRADGGPDFDALRAAVSPRTRGIFVNSPNNPSGYIWTADEVRTVAELAREHDLWILSDEIYRRLVYDGAETPSPAEVSADARARTIIVDGASKAFAMTGYRIGYLAANSELASAVARLHSHLTGSPNAVSQAALERALDEEPTEVATMVATYNERRQFLVPALNALGLATPMPCGAYYALSDVTPWLDERGIFGFCEDLLENEHLAVVPGPVFGVDGQIRLSFGRPMEDCKAAVERLKRFLAKKPRAVAGPAAS